MSRLPAAVPARPRARLTSASRPARPQAGLSAARPVRYALAREGDAPMPRAPLALAALLCLAAPGRADWVTLGFAGVADYALGADLARLGLSQGAAVSGT